ncbi:26S proteasome non-ATPase regulatory subunit 8 [Ciona intestinalis]
MAAGMKEAVTVYQSLKKEFYKKNANLNVCAQHLCKLKIALTGLSFLPSTQTTPTLQEFVLARDVLEIGAQMSILKRDIPAFERYMSQLKCYYLDYTEDVPESAYKQELLGLNLLCLLAQNRVAEFHTELERLSTNDILNNVYIRHPIAIEQYLMEGNYNKLFLAKGNVPAESYNYFIDILLGTIRDEIATCIEKSYPRISYTEARRMLYFESENELDQYSKNRDWELGAGKYFCFNITKQNEETGLVATAELAQQVIKYAKELEMII